MICDVMNHPRSFHRPRGFFLILFCRSQNIHYLCSGINNPSTIKNNKYEETNANPDDAPGADSRHGHHEL